MYSNNRISTSAIPVTSRYSTSYYLSFALEKFNATLATIDVFRRAVTLGGGICRVMFTQTSPVLPFFSSCSCYLLAKFRRTSCAVRFTYTLYT